MPIDGDFMISYRGINDIDTRYLFDQSSNSIKCSLDSMKIDTKLKRTIYDEIHNGEMSLSLDRTIGHISGKNIGGSSWISTSIDFNFVATEYAIPQAGKYNSFPYRKNIIVVDSTDEIDVLNLKNRYEASNEFVGKYIDLSNGNLKRLVDFGFIKALYQNENSYYYDCLKDFSNKLNGKGCVNINGFSNFATGAKECLFYREIPKKNIVSILTPLVQDLIYIETCGKNICDSNKIVFDCINKYKDLNLNDYDFTPEEMNMINFIYNKNEFGNYYCIINLIPYFYNVNDNLEVDELYEVLKNIKRNILAKISGCKDIPLVDDKIYAVRYENFMNKVLSDGRPITKTNQYDIIYRTDENRVLVKN